MGHGVKRCKEPIKEENQPSGDGFDTGAGDGFDTAAGDGFDTVNTGGLDSGDTGNWNGDSSISKAGAQADWEKAPVTSTGNW